MDKVMDFLCRAGDSWWLAGIVWAGLVAYAVFGGAV